MPLRNVWHLYNLSESPFFQDPLRAGERAKHRLDLFVGREAEAERLAHGVAGRSSSRQVIHGPPGVGKSTLAQYVKDRLARERGARVLSSPDAVSLGHADDTDAVCVKILGYVYEAVVSNGDFTTHAIEAVDEARQVVRVFRVDNYSAGVSLPAIGGVSGSRSKAYVNPATARPSVVVPGLLRRLGRVAEEHLGARGVLVHLNNLENLTEADAKRAAAVLRDVRDTLLLADGFHWVVVGTVDALRTVVASQAQVRSVFMMPRALAPLALPEVEELLARRYEHLKENPKKPVLPPVTSDVVRELYTLFRGDLRGTLRALDEAAQELLGYGREGPAAPMALSDVRAVLGRVYAEEMRHALTPALRARLRRMAEHSAGRGPEALLTQKEATALWGVSQPAASKILGELQAHGYVTEVDRLAPEEGGRATMHYALTGAARLALGDVVAPRPPKRLGTTAKKAPADMPRAPSVPTRDATRPGTRDRRRR
jgi:hypothetical protein